MRIYSVLFPFYENARKLMMLLRDLISFVQYKKRKRHPWSVTSSKDGFTFSISPKVTLLHGYFSRFLNCTNDTKLRKASHVLMASLVW